MIKLLAKVVLLGATCITTLAHSAISLDRTRVIFNGNSQSVSIAIKNKNDHLAYLAQSWIENANGEKISQPFVVLPPLQRVEPDQGSQIRIEAMENKIEELPQDRETIFYFNLREIPPKSNKPNVLQIALQSKIKMFYRPSNIILTSTEMNNNPWQEKLVLEKQGTQVLAKNPTAYYTTILSLQTSKDSKINQDVESLMIPPFSEVKLPITVKDMGNSPVLTYVNDYGATPKLQFQCQSDSCQVVKIKE